MTAIHNRAETDREIQIYTERDKLSKHIVVELAQQITSSFMQWNKNSPHAIITIKNHK